MLIIGTQHIETNEEGYLIHLNDWNKEVADAIAEKEGLTLSDEHWEIINFLRAYYEAHQSTPAIRALVKGLKEKFGPDKGNSIYLHTLFPKGPAKQGSKIAGLPKPKRCI